MKKVEMISVPREQFEALEVRTASLLQRPPRNAESKYPRNYANVEINRRSSPRNFKITSK